MDDSNVIPGIRGQIVCRPSNWVDVLKFFVFNYGLHVLTIVTIPGGKAVPYIIRSLGALLLPFSGTFTALDVIHRFARGQSGDLATAHRAGALCMFLPTHLLDASAYDACNPDRWSDVNTGSYRQAVDRQVTHVHGQHPLLVQSSPTHGRSPWVLSIWIFTTIHRLKRDIEMTRMPTYDHPPESPSSSLHRNSSNETGPFTGFSLIAVPQSFTVAKLSNAGFTPLVLSCNYSWPKAIVAIIQVIYGTSDLYQSSVRQLPRFGYAAYSLTVIPYIMMSIVNLVATLCEPQYPAMFLVRYGGDRDPRVTARTNTETLHDINSAAETAAGWEELIPGAVGNAYGNLRGDLSGNRSFDVKGGETVGRWMMILIGGWCLFAVPYITIYLLTGFEGRDSTDTQRGFTMAWLAIGQMYGWTLYSLPEQNGLFNQLRMLTLTLTVSAGAVGGLVVVGHMLIDDEVCTVI